MGNINGPIRTVRLGNRVYDCSRCEEIIVQKEAIYCNGKLMVTPYIPPKFRNIRIGKDDIFGKKTDIFGKTYTLNKNIRIESPDRVDN